MKKLLTLILLPSFLFFSCKKNGGPSLKGTWELRATRGGNVMPQTFQAGNGHLLSISDTSYYLINNTQVVLHGPYQIKHANNGDYFVTHYGEDRFTLLKDSLTLFPLTADMASQIYIRVSNEPVR